MHHSRRIPAARRLAPSRCTYVPFPGSSLL
jgi:hypothetical protein